MKQIFIKLAESLRQNDIAKLYLNLEPNRYCRSEVLGWFEYKKFNVSEPQGITSPTNLSTDRPDRIQDIFNKDRKKHKEHIRNIVTIGKKNTKI